jgi:hypothetical protein
VRSGAFVEHDGVVGEREGAVREAGRHPDDLVVLVGELDGDVIAQGRRTVAHVDDHVDDRAVHATDVLAHRRRPLKMQAAHDTASRVGLDGLIELRRDALLVEVGLHPRLQQEAALIVKVLGFDDPDAGDFVPLTQHGDLR